MEARSYRVLTGSKKRREALCKTLDGNRWRESGIEPCCCHRRSMQRCGEACVVVYHYYWVTARLMFIAYAEPISGNTNLVILPS